MNTRHEVRLALMSSTRDELVTARKALHELEATTQYSLNNQEWADQAVGKFCDALRLPK